MGVTVGVCIGIANGVGEDVGLGVGVRVGINVGKGVGITGGVSNGDGESDSADGVSGVSFAVAIGSLAVGVGLGTAVDPGSNQSLTLFPLTNVACNLVFPWIRMTGPSNFPRTILPV